MAGCDLERDNILDNKNIFLPKLTTTAILSVSSSSTASSGGTISSDGGKPIIARGVCWSISPNPTIKDSITVDGGGMGAFKSNIKGLIANTKYYVRAYATNGIGTAYGNQVSFVSTPTLGFSRYTVYSDNNADGIINKGEAIKLKLYLKNNGTSTANKVRGTFTCSSSYISGLTQATSIGFYQSSYYDYIDKDQEAAPYSSGDYLGFNVSSLTPAGTVITFNVSITDESKNIWTDSFTITVY